MKKFITIMITLTLWTLLLSSGSALAWHGHYRGPFGIFPAPPPFWVGPPAVYYRGYYPTPGYYPPGYYEPYRVWVPGYWQDRWTPHGWQRVWIPGYWQYRR